MSSIGKRHREIMNGSGKCSVPMWSMGLPAGFCDRPAYGEPPPTQERYVPALACSGHGGPTLKKFLADKLVIRFDGSPGPEGPRFVEAERGGTSVNAGDWVKDGDDWLLVIAEPTEGAEDE